MDHFCSRCGRRLRRIESTSLWSTHKVCLACGIVFTCWDSAVSRCDAPGQHCPWPWHVIDAYGEQFTPVLPGPLSRGLI